MANPLKSLPLPQVVKSPLRKLLVWHYESAFNRGRLNVLFIVGHMRSGSTLLLHILNTNPAISGYGETHREYRTTRDFAYLTFNVCRAFRRFRARGRYVLDKILYNDYVVNPELLEGDRVKLVFLVRSPEQSIPSILRFQPRHIHTEAQALDYYVKQLKMVEKYARRKNDPRGSFFLTYDQLMGDPDPLLADLTAFLGLETPLSSEYETIWSTGQRGKRGFGDDSPEIKAGKIVKKRNRQKIDLAPETVRRARIAYEHCLEVLPQFCTHTPPADVKPIVRTAAKR
jgi:hypothetical protein